ncbi:hypothetical protein EYY60_20705 [Flavobacterium zhairuonense]|uniref:hypothetical protein n=1 Tax=Flavobacterium zhairuonense TaxID=2493631 RepID=UPI00104D9C20|nr:hypothetical protein [Flavobacterium zhairuonense]KAF2506937.1 hypothetical protein EYY60_20705 [Flavobacterium zhairuonense]
MSKYDVFELVAHLRKCPDSYLRSSDFFEEGGLNSLALIADTYRIVSNNFLKKDFKNPSNFDLKLVDDNHWRAIHISTWLLCHPDFVNNPQIENKLHQFWFEELLKTTVYVKHNEWISDDERAEEMVRLLLYCCEIIPYGENHNEAADKLSSINSEERYRVLKESYEAHERIMRIQREMAEQKAREAANVYGRE